MCEWEGKRTRSRRSGATFDTVVEGAEEVKPLQLSLWAVVGVTGCDRVCESAEEPLQSLSTAGSTTQSRLFHHKHPLSPDLVDFCLACPHVIDPPNTNPRSNPIIPLAPPPPAPSTPPPPQVPSSWLSVCCSAACEVMPLMSSQQLTMCLWGLASAGASPHKAFVLLWCLTSMGLMNTATTQVGGWVLPGGRKAELNLK